MPEYRAIREKYGFLEMVKTPELAAEVTMQPLRAFDLDAGIIFSDILPPLQGIGIDLTFEKGEGPVIHNPIRNLNHVAALHDSDPKETMGFTLDAIRMVKQELAGRIPLIGFSGSPFTLACYAIEGGGSKEYRNTKLFMYQTPGVWHDLMSKLSRLVSDYLLAQIDAGVDAVQIFDSWAGALAPDDYAEYVLPYVRDVITRVHTATRGGFGAASDAILHGTPAPVPVIYFSTGTSGLLPMMPQLGADVIGVDWRIALDDAWAQLGPDVAIQGNLDPMVLHAPWLQIKRRAADVLQRAAGRPGHIFNLGHGILTETPVDNIKRLVELVHDYSRR